MLDRMPFEVMALVLRQLGVQDSVRLSLVSKQLNRILMQRIYGELTFTVLLCGTSEYLVKATSDASPIFGLYGILRFLTCVNQMQAFIRCVHVHYYICDEVLNEFLEIWGPCALVPQRGPILVTDVIHHKIVSQRVVVRELQELLKLASAHTFTLSPGIGSLGGNTSCIANTPA